MNTTLALLLRHGFAAFAGFLTHKGVAASATDTTSLVAGLIVFLVVCVCSAAGKATMADSNKVIIQKLAGIAASQFVSALAGWLQASATDAADPVALSLLGGNAVLSHTRGQFPALDAALKQWTGVVITCLCALQFTSCTGLLVALSNPAVDTAIVSLAEIGLERAVAKKVVTPGQSIAIQNSLAVITDPKDSTLNKVVKLEAVGLDAAYAAGKINEGDVIAVKQATAIITTMAAAARAPAAPAAKQPVKVAPSTASTRAPDDVPARLKLKQRVPLYGYQVALMLSNGATR